MAKSSFWDDLGNTLTRKAKGLSSRAENLYEIQKIRNKLSAQERMTEKLMMDIGKMIYTRYEQGEAVDGETGAICEEISQHMLEADHYRDAIAASKGEKFCPACHKAVMREASFCPYCGAACPTAELEEKAADVIEQADEELEEAAEAEVTEVPETEAEENAEVTDPLISNVISFAHKSKSPVSLPCGMPSSEIITLLLHASSLYHPTPVPTASL